MSPANRQRYFYTPAGPRGKLMPNYIKVPEVRSKVLYLQENWKAEQLTRERAEQIVRDEDSRLAVLAVEGETFSQTVGVVTSPEDLVELLESGLPLFLLSLPTGLVRQLERRATPVNTLTEPDSKPETGTKSGDGEKSEPGSEEVSES